MIDVSLLEKAFRELKVGIDRREKVMRSLREIGQDAQSNLENLPIRNPSALRRELKAMDGDIGRFLGRFGFKDSVSELDAALSSSRAICLSITNYANLTYPERHKHWPLDDPSSREHLGSFFAEIDTLRKAVNNSMNEVSDQIKKGWGGDRRKVDAERQEAAWHLMRLYYEERGIVPGVSKNPHRTGPAVRFLEFSLSAYGFTLKPSTAANFIDKLKSDPELPWNRPILG